MKFKFSRFEEMMPTDIEPFRPRGTVVRLFIGDEWYVGMLRRFSMENEGGDIHYLGLSPMARFSHRSPYKADDPGEILLTEADKAISGSCGEDNQAFKILEPKKIIWENSVKNLMVIKFTNGSAVLSRRKNDWAVVKKMLEAAKTLI